MNRVFLLLIAVSFIAIISSADVSVPAGPDNYVIDLAGIIESSTEAAPNRSLLELEKKTTPGKKL